MRTEQERDPRDGYTADEMNAMVRGETTPAEIVEEGPITEQVAWLFDARQCPDASVYPATAVQEVEAAIIDGYVPPFAREGHKPMVCIVSGEWWLRYSKGPQTGTFWDAYGDDFHTVELARTELAKAPPVRAGKPGITFTLPIYTAEVPSV